MKTPKSLFLFSFVVAVLGGGPVAADEVRVAVAANFTDATRDLVPLFERVTGHTAKVSFGSTGKLYSQIENGAPFQVFLAADTRRPVKAEAEGLAVPGSRFVYARGRLVLWSAGQGAFADGEEYLKRGGFVHLAIANPKTAPYGLAARQVLEHLGVWRQVAPSLVRGDSISQAFQFAATGNADVGFVAYSQLKAWRGDPGTTWEVPADYYAPMAQSAVLLETGESSPAARAFLDFLKSDAAREVIEGFGYGVGDH